MRRIRGLVTRTRRHLMPVLALFVVGCSEEGPLSFREVRETRVALAKWHATTARAAYRYEVRRSCFCPPEWSAWSTVTVIGGIVTDVRVTATGQPVPRQQWAAYPTVDALFASLSSTRDEYLADIVVRFDRVYGYPVELSTFAKPDVLDGGGSIYATNLQPVP